MEFAQLTLGCERNSLVNSHLRQKIKFENLQALRGVAALLVVLSHIQMLTKVTSVPNGVLPWIDGIGRLGVVLFFVLSGFLMALRQTRDRLSPYAFITRRLGRVVPLYWIATAIYAVALTVMARPPSIDLLARSMSFISGLAGGGIPLVWVGWTIEYEILFYLIFGLVMLLAKKFQNTLAVLGICTLVAFGVDPIALNFVFGITAGSLFDVLKKDNRYRLIWGASAATAGSAFILVWLAEPNGYNWVQGLIGATFILSLAKTYELQNRAISLLGETSYSIYLVQVFTIPLTFATLKISALPAIGVNLAAACALIVTLAAGAAVHRFVDRRIQIRLRKLRT